MQALRVLLYQVVPTVWHWFSSTRNNPWLCQGTSHMPVLSSVTMAGFACVVVFMLFIYSIEHSSTRGYPHHHMGGSVYVTVAKTVSKTSRGCRRVFRNTQLAAVTLYELVYKYMMVHYDRFLGMIRTMFALFAHTIIIHVIMLIY